MMPCSACNDQALRRLAEALAADDLDRALTLGLLEARPEEIAEPCADCRSRASFVIAARDERLRAFAARERYRARQARLAERAKIRARKRAAATPATSAPATSATALPPAAAAALARAKARVAAKPQPE
jgi:hypothetical protein